MAGGPRAIVRLPRRDLDELEAHLRDSVTALQARDLSAEEAFYVATKRVGNGAMLVKEFGKINAVNVWVERSLWALIAMQTWTVIQTIFMTMGISLHVYGPSLISADSIWSTISSVMLYSIIPMMVVVLIFWGLFKSPKSKLGGFLENLSVRPGAVALLFFLLSVGAHFFHAYMVKEINRWEGAAFWMVYVWYLPASGIYSGLIFLLARKRLLRKA